MTKACTKCKQCKPLSDFPVYYYNGNLNYRGICRSCKTQADHDRKKRKMDIDPSYAEKVRAGGRDSAKRCRPRRRIYEAEYRAKNKDAINKQVNERRKSNPEKYKAKMKRDRQLRRDKVSVRDKQRAIEVAPQYVKQILTGYYKIPLCQVTTELITLKQKQLKLHRHVKQAISQ